MWLDVLLSNRADVADALQATETALGDLRRLIAAGDADGLRAYLTAAQRFREGLDR